MEEVYFNKILPLVLLLIVFGLQLAKGSSDNNSPLDCLTETALSCAGGIMIPKDGKCVCKYGSFEPQNKIVVAADDDKKKDATICPDKEIICINGKLIVKDGKCSCEHDEIGTENKIAIAEKDEEEKCKTNEDCKFHPCFVADPICKNGKCLCDHGPQPVKCRTVMDCYRSKSFHCPTVPDCLKQAHICVCWP